MMRGNHYYPNLSGLRAIAALVVVFTHIEEMRRSLGREALIDPGFNAFIGGVAVTFFFVLSGLLITGLLLNEKKRLGTIRLKRFFINRALRIWPLYYLVLLAGYLLSIFAFRETGINVFHNGFILNALLLPNIAFACGLLPNILIQLWSIGPEEQFYFSWPFLVNRFTPKQLVGIFTGIILFWAASIGALRILYGPDTWLHLLLFRTRIDCMAIGGLAALLLFYQQQPEGWWTGLYRLLQRRATGWAAAALFVLLLSVSYSRHFSLYQLYAALSALLILRAMTRPAGWLESAPLRYLGKISYGIYLLHPFAIYFVFRIMKGPASAFPFLTAVLLTVALAAISYRFFERRFLKRKR